MKQYFQHKEDLCGFYYVLCPFTWMDVKHDFGEDIPFVGRDNDFTAVDAEWTENECRIYEVFGIRAVGKSRFVSEFLRRKKTSVLHVDLSSTVNVDVLYNVLITSLHVPPISGASDTRKWMPHVIAELIKFSSTRDVTLFLDNAEDALESSWKDELLSLCCRTVKSCPRLKLCITSTKRVHFSELGKVFRCFELQPLRLTDAKQLLHVVTRGIDLGGYGNAIAELSEGLPLLILLVGEELRKGLYGQKNAISPETVVQLLLNSRLKQFSGGCLQDEENIVGKKTRKLREKYLVNETFIFIECFIFIPAVNLNYLLKLVLLLFRDFRHCFVFLCI